MSKILSPLTFAARASVVKKQEKVPPGEKLQELCALRGLLLRVRPPRRHQGTNQEHLTVRTTSGRHLVKISAHTVK